jgi:hydrogenase maturation protease
MTPTILVAGIGNIFLGDDGFGVEVARCLAQRKLPEEVQVRDFGIRGFDLAYALLDPWDAIVLVDALPRGEPAGTLFVLEPDLTGMGNRATPGMDLNPHGMDPMRVLNLAASMGAITARILVAGCEPNDFGNELEGRMGLSPVVAAAVEAAATMIEELVEQMLAENRLRAAEMQMVGEVTR